jgi:hypothetical protein
MLTHFDDPVLEARIETAIRQTHLLIQHTQDILAVSATERVGRAQCRTCRQTGSLRLSSLCWERHYICACCGARWTVSRSQ